MTLTDEELDALARRLADAGWKDPRVCNFDDIAREAARWAEERQGEVVWEAMERDGGWRNTLGIKLAKECEEDGRPVRSIRVIATTTKGMG